MICSNCGGPLGGNEKFCPRCGAPVELVPAPDIDPQRVTLCPDGKYRWSYEMSLFKNPSIFLLIWKIFFFIILGIFAFVTVIDVVKGAGDRGAAALNDLKMFGIFLGGMTVLVGVSYLIYAAIMGGKYAVDFEMDEKGVNHAQTPAQARKARKLGQLTMAAGAARGSFATVGLGVGVQSAERYSDFSKVRKVKAYPRRSIIKVNSPFNHNQVYARPEDFDFVRGFIVSHCPNVKK